jgi:hypothetical protein
VVETYNASEQRLYYIDEAAFGTTPANPTMLSVPEDSIEPSIDPGNIRLRGAGSGDLMAIKKGLRAATLKLSYPLPSDAPINLLQYARNELNKSLSMQLLYFKGVFSVATDIISLLFTGMKVNKANVSCSIEDVVRASLELQGIDVTVGAAKISGATYTDYAGAVPFYESYVKKDTATYDRVSDWSFNVENNLKPVPVIRTTNGHLLKYLPSKKRDLSGSVTFEFESIQEASDVLADSDFTLEFGLGGANKAVFSNCKWDGVSIPSKMDDLIALKAPFVAKTFTIS